MRKKKNRNWVGDNIVFIHATIDESQRSKTASIVPKYNFDFSNAICIHDDLIAGFQYASELVDTIKFRLREKLRRNGRKPREDGRNTKERKDKTTRLQFMNVNDVWVGEAISLSLSLLICFNHNHFVRSIHICMNLANSSLRMRQMPYTCVQTRNVCVWVNVWRPFGALRESASWMRNRINFGLAITAPCHEPRAENRWQSSLLPRPSHRLSHTQKNI